MINPLERRPYFSSFGFRRAATAEAVLSHLPKTKRHLFAVGVTVTPASLDVPDGVHASAEEAKAILRRSGDARFFYLVKYQSPAATKNQPTLGSQLKGRLPRLGNGITAVQIAGVPITTLDAQDLGLFAHTSSMRLERIVLEVDAAMLVAGSAQRLLGSHVHGHAHTCSDVLLTFPGAIDVSQARGILTELRANFRQIGYGLRGALTGDTVLDLAELAADFPELSLEMETPDEEVDPDEVLMFFAAAASLF